MEIMDQGKFVSHISECIRHKTYGNNGPREVCFHIAECICHKTYENEINEFTNTSRFNATFVSNVSLVNQIFIHFTSLVTIFYVSSDFFSVKHINDRG